MNDEVTFDPYVLAAVLVYLVVAGGLGAVLTTARIAGRAGLWEQLRHALSQAKEMGAATFAPLAGGQHGEFLVLAKGKHVQRLPGGKPLSPITRAALVKDKDGQTGLVLEHGGETTCVTGLEPMTRAYAQLQQDDVPIDIVFRDDEGQRVVSMIQSLLPQEQAMVTKWLVQGEVLTDVVKGVDYEGTLNTPGSKGQATLLVTNLRVGLLAQTILVENLGNATRTTTSLNLVTFLLPVAKQVTMERTTSLGKPEWRLRLELPPDPNAPTPETKAPVLKLTPDHTGVFLPLVVFKRPVRVVDEGAGAGRVVLETIWPAIGCGVLLGGVAALNAALYYGQNQTYHGRYIVPAAIAGLLTPALFKALSLVEAMVERRRAQAAEELAAG